MSMRILVLILAAIMGVVYFIETFQDYTGVYLVVRIILLGVYSVMMYIELQIAISEGKG